MEKIIDRIRKFNEDRDWLQFHKPVNLAKSLVIEASELLELYQWSDEVNSIESLKDELADVFMYALMIADHYEFNINEVIMSKINKNEEKYPIEKSKGKSNKYTDLK